MHTCVDTGLNGSGHHVIHFLHIEDFSRAALVGTNDVDSGTGHTSVSLVTAIDVERIQVVVITVQELDQLHPDGLSRN